MQPSFRKRVIFSDQMPKHLVGFLNKDESVENRIWTTEYSDLKWIEKSTQSIGDFRALLRSVYIRWAITINALYVARDRYASNQDLALDVKTLRLLDGNLEPVRLAVWENAQAAANYELCVPLMNGYAIQDLYGALEEIIIELYSIYVDFHPKRLMRDIKYKKLNNLYNNRNNSEEDKEAFTEAWNNRLREWKKSRTYEGLAKVFASYWKSTNLIRPSHYENSDINDWCQSIKTIGEIRNLVVHGENNVSEELASLCSAHPHLGLEYAKNEELHISLLDLMIVEEFLDNLLTIINHSLVELGVRESKKKR